MRQGVPREGLEGHTRHRAAARCISGISLTLLAGDFRSSRAMAAGC
jgi:hypothetical protein